jgi:hypothetical protein
MELLEAKQAALGYLLWCIDPLISSSSLLSKWRKNKPE